MRMGPFQLLDLVGADVSVAVMESLYGQFYQEPMYAPQPLMRTRVDGGAYGQKTGGGWYAYEDGKRVDPAPARGAVGRSAEVGLGVAEPQPCRPAGAADRSAPQARVSKSRAARRRARTR